jgi:hypothetical protein
MNYGNSRNVLFSRLSVFVNIKAPAEVVFLAATDWGNQGEWLLGTKVRKVSIERNGIGTKNEVF